VDHPISLYAATKKSNELMAHTYSHLYGFPATGLRFFTVYGPWGRPDMAMFLFTDAIVKGEPIKVFNYGKMERDFTYIDDITEGVVRVIEGSVEKRLSLGELYKIYNIGNNNSVKLLDFIEAIEKRLGKVAMKELLPMQAGDVTRTWANVDDLIRDYDYQPNTSIEKGVGEFVAWYLSYYQI
jgi:UDP-glucuronate 4-epimerase